MSAGNSVIGLVLAGGQSSRMGQDKSQLQWNGVPLYEHMAGIMDQAGISKVMISSNHLQGKEVVADVIPGRGPLGGIHAALSLIPDGDSLLVIPVDMPLLPIVAVQRLAQQKEICSYQNFTLPLLLVVTPALRQQVESNIHSENRRDYSLWKLHQALQGKTIELSESPELPESMAHAFSNANTPEDWQQCQVLGHIV